MRELVGSQLLVLLGLALFAFGLAADIVQIRLVGLELVDEVSVVVADGAVDFLELALFLEHFLTQRAEVYEFLLDLVAE